jgi:L-2-hydroxyglutarate oxidase LhgO
MIEGGILIVARAESEIATLKELERRAAANGVEARIVDEADLRDIEPAAAGIRALHAPEGASFDSKAYVTALLADATAAGATVRYGVRVRSLDSAPGDVLLRTSAGPFEAVVVVNCAGLHADRVAGAVSHDLRVIPFRGYYAELTAERRHLIRSHLYAAPDLEFPFLGVHLSRQADGRVLIGPGAMLAFGREAYRLHQVSPRDLAETVTWPGFGRFLMQGKATRMMRREIHKSLSLKAIWREARLLVPQLQAADLVRSFAGNRAQLVTRDGKLVDDMLVRETERAVHVLNAVSPGLTASLPFGEHLADRACTKLG